MMFDMRNTSSVALTDTRTEYSQKQVYLTFSPTFPFATMATLLGYYHWWSFGLWPSLLTQTNLTMGHPPWYEFSLLGQIAISATPCPNTLQWNREACSLRYNGIRPPSKFDCVDRCGHTASDLDNATNSSNGKVQSFSRQSSEEGGKQLEKFVSFLRDGCEWTEMTMTPFVTWTILSLSHSLPTTTMRMSSPAMMMIMIGSWRLAGAASTSSRYVTPKTIFLKLPARWSNSRNGTRMESWCHYARHYGCRRSLYPSCRTTEGR